MEYFDRSFIKPLPPYLLHRFNSDEMSCLRTSYVTFLPNINPLDVPQLCRKYKSLQSSLFIMRTCSDHKSTTSEWYWKELSSVPGVPNFIPLPHLQLWWHANIATSYWPLCNWRAYGYMEVMHVGKMLLSYMS